MSTFDKREEGFELRFAHEEEVRFKVRARRNKMVGLWAAEKLGLAGAAADAYAKEVVMAISRGPATTWCSASCAATSAPRRSRSPIIRSATPWKS